ncbi:hypothetical protein GCM10022224_081070 [Nonomuraea antimicrobica]|uniref:Uncharacterized protein n=1 Tax=Nonomuraea antimicrobica TaxID=561173 RepID=A0ABP7DEI1_9ACTN
MQSEIRRYRTDTCPEPELLRLAADILEKVVQHERAPAQVQFGARLAAVVDAEQTDRLFSPARRRVTRRRL